MIPTLRRVATMSSAELYRPHALRVELWPPACREAWRDALMAPDLFDDAKPASNWRPATVTKIRKGFGVYLHWLARQGCLDDAGAPAELVLPARAKAYQAALIETGAAPLTISNRLAEVYSAMRALAPHVDWSWLSKAVKQLRQSARTVRHKISHMQPVHLLAELGNDLMRRAESASGLSAYQRALTYRDGLMVALLARRPFRLKNFTALTLDGSIVLADETGSLMFSRNETKGKRAIELPFPARLWRELQIYLKVYRPYLLTLQQVAPAGPVDALRLSNEGRGMVDGSIRVAIRKRTRTAFGQHLWPHLFRDCAVTTLVRDAPASARLTRDILGHTSIDVTNAHYNQAQMIEASRRHMAMMETLSRQTA